MEPNGRKVVVVRSAMTIINKLVDPLRLVFIDPQIGLTSRRELAVRSGEIVHAPLSVVNSTLKVCPFELETAVNPIEIKWQKVKAPGDSSSKLIKFVNEEEAGHEAQKEFNYSYASNSKTQLAISFQGLRVHQA